MARDNPFVREKMFEDFSSNLALYEPENTGMFKCPVCLNLFTKDYLVSRPRQNAIIIAHIIPKSFLNAGFTLCCIKCDGKLGTDLTNAERALRHNMRLAKWENKPYSTKSTFFTPNGEFSALVDIKWNKKGEPVPKFRESDFPQDISSEDLKKQYTSFITRDERGNPDDFSLWKNYQYDKKYKNANLNWWYSLYLFMFHHFGYEWVLKDTRAELIRNQISNIDSNIIPDIFLEPKVVSVDIPFEAPPHDHLPVRTSLHFGYDANGDIIDSGYFVVFPKLHKNMNHITLFLPWDFQQCNERPTPVKFTNRLRYGHSILKHRIPDCIKQSDVVKYVLK